MTLMPVAWIYRMEAEAVLRLQLGPQLGFQTGPVDTVRWFCPECKA
jgi:hypothetical protein